MHFEESRIRMILKGILFLLAKNLIISVYQGRWEDGREMEHEIAQLNKKR